LMLSREYSDSREHGHDSGTLAFAARCHSLTMRKHGLLARIEWRGGEEQGWMLRDVTTDCVRTAAYPYRRNGSNGVNAQVRQRACDRHRPARARTRRTL
ncbi:MAG: NADP transhydrogenase subunit beta, partial [Paraburkholderia nemoris]